MLKVQEIQYASENVKCMLYVKQICFEFCHVSAEVLMYWCMKLTIYAIIQANIDAVYKTSTRVPASSCNETKF